MKMVIVTGANGFIGSTLINRLLMKNVFIVAIDINFKNCHLPEKSQIKKIEIGLDNIGSLLGIIPVGEYDAFYHFAWQGINGSDKADPDVQLKNIQMSINCAVVAKKIGCKKLLCAGTVAEQSVNSLTHLDIVNGGMIYGVAKHCTHLILETYCKHIGQEFVWMQFSNIYGPKNKTGNLISYTISQLKNNQEAAFGPSLQSYDFIYIDDLIEAIVRLGEYKTEQNVYFIGSGEPRILKEYLIEIGEKCGAQELIRIGKRPDDGIIYTMDMFDNTVLKDTIGDYISTTFSEGIKYTIENY